MKTINFTNKMMKKILKLTAVLFLAAMVPSCVEDDDFSVPETAATAVEIEGTEISLNDLYSRMVQDDYLTIIEDDSDLYVSGYVVSSDEAGNFFEELLIQDEPSEPSRGARLSIDSSPLSIKYNLGRKIYVRLAGLTITTSTEPDIFGGSVQNEEFLGMNIGRGTTLGRIEPIGRFEESDIITRDPEVAEIVYNTKEINDLSVEDLYTAFKLEDVQFDRRQIDLTYAGEERDEFDGDRTLTSCSNNASALFQTSTFADYKSVSLPDGKGDINAVLTTDFFGENYVITVNTSDDLSLNDSNRCDPNFLECTTPGNGGSNVLLDQDFEGIFNESQLDTADYININVSGGSERYEIGSFSSNTYLQVNAFGQPDDPMVAWLVLPSLDFDGTTNEAIEFAIQANYDQGGLLEVLISNDFTGDVTTTDWAQIDADIPIGPSGDFADRFTNVDPINISCIDGDDIRIAFKYTASDPQETTTRYHIDNIVVSGD